jgi:3-hydroxybutyryl-CoA dehydrogenase
MPALGVVARADFAGLKLEQRALANHTYTPPRPNGYCETLDALLPKGRDGLMSGKGFFDWEGRSPKELFRERDRKLIALKRAMRDIGTVEGR